MNKNGWKEDEKIAQPIRTVKTFLFYCAIQPTRFLSDFYCCCRYGYSTAALLATPTHHMHTKKIVSFIGMPKRESEIK